MRHGLLLGLDPRDLSNRATFGVVPGESPVAVAVSPSASWAVVLDGSGLTSFAALKPGTSRWIDEPIGRSEWPSPEERTGWEPLSIQVDDAGMVRLLATWTSFSCTDSTTRWWTGEGRVPSASEPAPSFFWSTDPAPGKGASMDPTGALFAPDGRWIDTGVRDGLAPAISADMRWAIVTGWAGVEGAAGSSFNDRMDAWLFGPLTPADWNERPRASTYALSPVGRWLLAISGTLVVRWDLQTGAATPLDLAPDFVPLSLAWSTDGAYAGVLGAAGREGEGEVTVFRPGELTPAWTARVPWNDTGGHGGPPQRVAAPGGAVTIDGPDGPVAFPVGGDLEVVWTLAAEERARAAGIASKDGLSGRTPLCDRRGTWSRTQAAADGTFVCTSRGSVWVYADDGRPGRRLFDEPGRR